MFLNKIQCCQRFVKKHIYSNRRVHLQVINLQTPKAIQLSIDESAKHSKSTESKSGETLPTPRIIPMMLSNKDPIVLSFDDIPGPKSLKYLSSIRTYVSEIGTQFTAAVLTFGLNIGSYISSKKSIRNFTNLFDEYGPVVRFVSPVGGDIVLLNHPEHIKKVFSMEGDYPVRSTLESLEKYRAEHRSHVYGGIYTVQGQEWIRKKSLVENPLHVAGQVYATSIYEMCDKFTQKIYNLRNYQDEISKDFYKEIHKWAFDCMGMIIFSKPFSMIDTEVVNSQCDMSWMYHCLEQATDALDKCETGPHLWKVITTPAWYKLVKYCDNLDHLIGKHVLEAERETAVNADTGAQCLLNAILLNDPQLTTEDTATIVMDMLIIGVNTVASSMSYLLYNIAMNQKAQSSLYAEVEHMYPDLKVEDVTKLKEKTPYLQACIKETLRLTPPIPLLTRILPKNITLDRYNIPRGTLIIMCTQEAALKESNYDDAKKFDPDRWLKAGVCDYHTFASIPFGYGARKCLGQNIAETMLSLLTIRVMQKYKLEYHYGEVRPTQRFISKPSKPLKIRFIDRM